jgi:hypothetical protein
MKLTSPHRLSPSLMLATVALAVASSGTAIAAGGRGSGGTPIAKANAMGVLAADHAPATEAIGKPRRLDESLLPRLGR